MLDINGEVHLVVDDNDGQWPKDSFDRGWTISAGFSVTACGRQFGGLDRLPPKKAGRARREYRARTIAVNCSLCRESPHFLSQAMLQAITQENERLIEPEYERE